MMKRLTAGSMTTPEYGEWRKQWRQEIQGERNKADRWERKAQETQ
ncbi:hypothetical protein Goklo_024005, partial [Gossypium klotzschianum]|nr:hypothetical protein [Gossypium klotzschianum]